MASESPKMIHTGSCATAGSAILPVKAFDATGSESPVTYLSSFSKNDVAQGSPPGSPNPAFEVGNGETGADLHASFPSSPFHLAQGHYESTYKIVRSLWFGDAGRMLDSPATHFLRMSMDRRWVECSCG